MADLDLSSPELSDAGRALAEAAGLSLSSGLRRTLRDAIVAAAAEAGGAPLELARRIAGGDRAAIAAVVEHAVVLETCFFRHPEQLDALSRHALGAPGPVSIWCAGCASGEEAYSVAIALLEAGREGRGDRVLATDVSQRALAAAREARYGPWPLRRLAPAVVARHFEEAAGDDRRRVGAAARDLVELRRHNLVAEPPPGGPFDAVLCRNVLIYFEPAVAAAVLYRLAASVRPGGFLVLGPVELPLAAALSLEWVDEGAGTLLRKPDPPRRPAGGAGGGEGESPG